MAQIIKAQDNRRVFIDTLIELAENDPAIVLIIPDVGFNYCEKFQEKFPNRFFNFGVTEQTTMLIAAGMALSGLKPYVYSMIPFVLFRPYEMVRNGIVCHKSNVKLLGVKGSSAYKFLGFSHNLLHEDEDIRCCENIGLESYIPKTIDEVRDIILETYKSNEACYVRL